MNRADFIAFKDFILSKNPYFQDGFDNAFKDDETGGVYAIKDTDFVCVLPNDTLGNYFYLRNAQTINHSPNSALNLSDCKGSISGFDDIIEINLIAIVNGADEYELINSLRNTILQYSAFTVIPTQSNFNREYVLIDELKGLDEPEIARSLQRLKDETIVRMQLRVTKQFISSTCIDNPCKDCG